MRPRNQPMLQPVNRRHGLAVHRHATFVELIFEADLELALSGNFSDARTGARRSAPASGGAMLIHRSLSPVRIVRQDHAK